MANGYHVGQHTCRTTPWLEKVLSDNAGLGQWFSNSVALWNHLDNLKKKLLTLSSIPRHSGFTGTNVVSAHTSLKAPWVILTCSKVWEALVEENTFSLSFDFWYHLSLGIQGPPVWEAWNKREQILDFWLLRSRLEDKFVFKMQKHQKETRVASPYYRAETHMVQLTGTSSSWVMFVRTRKSCIRITGRNCIITWISMACKH